MKREKKRIRTPAQIQQRTRELRREMTPAEKLLWSHLRNKRLDELKFRRQHPLVPFISDFYYADPPVIEVSCSWIGNNVPL